MSGHTDVSKNKLSRYIVERSDTTQKSLDTFLKEYLDSCNLYGPFQDFLQSRTIQCCKCIMIGGPESSLQDACRMCRRKTTKQKIVDFLEAVVPCPITSLIIIRSSRCLL